MAGKNWTYTVIPGHAVAYKVPKDARPFAMHRDPNVRAQFHLTSIAHLRRCTGAPV